MRIRGGKSWLVAVLCASLFAHRGLAQETKLTFATLAPPGAFNSVNVLRPWASRVEAQSGGTLKIEFSEGYARANFTNALDRLLDDVIQITVIVPSNYAGRFPRSEVGNLPFTADSGRTAGIALWRLFQSGSLDAELKDFMPLAFYTFGTSGIHLVKTPPVTPRDLAGLRIVVASKVQGDTIKALGGAPIVMMPQDVYEGLQRGTADGLITSWNTFGIWKYGEVTTYHVDSQFGTAVGIVMLTRKKYDSLPAAARKALSDSATEAFSAEAGARQDEQNVQMRATVVSSSGQTIVTLSPELEQQWRERTAPILAAWAKSVPDGEKVLAGYQRYIAEVHASGGAPR